MKLTAFSRLLAASLAFCAISGSAMELAVIGPNTGILGPGRSLDCRALIPEQVCLEIAARGEIESGDNEWLNEFIDSVESELAGLIGKPMRVGKVFINSPGGDLRESMAIGRTFRERMISVQVPIDAICHSACVVALAGAVNRNPVGPTGVHAFYSENFIGPSNFGTRSEQYNLVAKELEEYVREMRISNRFIDLVNQTPHTMLKILDEQQLLDLGLAGVDPVYFEMVRNLSKQEQE